MKILILSHAQYITVGLQKIIEFAESLAGVGLDITLCVTSKTRKWGVSQHINNKVKIVEFPSFLFGNLRHGIDPFDILSRILFFRNRKFDVIHCVASRPTVFFPGIFLRKRHKSVLIYEWEDSFAERGVALEKRGAIYYYFFGFIEKYFEEAIVKYADGVVVVSEFLKKRAIRLGIKEENIWKQIKGSPFIEKKIMKKKEAKQKVISKTDIDTVIFTYVGSIYESDLNLLLRAYEKVSMSHPDVRLQLIGYNGRQPKAIPDKVKILPRLPYEDYILYLAATDVFLLPLKCSVANISRYPSKFGDYLAVGRPVIATPLPEIKKIIEAANCGYVSDDDTEEAFSEIIMKAINEMGKWTILGEKGRDYALKHLSWKATSQNMVSVYKYIKNKTKSINIQ